ncbi:MAG: hypothetical protein AAGD05_17075, partial [Bacteroidota bacterium]
LILFQNNKVQYDWVFRADYEEDLQPVALSFPLHLVFTQQKWDRWNPSVLLGLRYTHNIAEKKNDRLALNDQNWSIDLGTGVEIKFNKFKLKPELLVSLGLNNLHREGANDLFNRAIEHIQQDQIALRILFYGT